MRTNSLNNKHRKEGALIIGGNFQGLGILRSLGRHNVPTYLIDQEMCIGRFSRYLKKFFLCPSVKQRDIFFTFITDLARKENIYGWVVYPNDDDAVCFLAEYKVQLEDYYRIATPSWNFVKFALEKKLTYQLAENLGVATPKTFFPKDVSELEQLDLPYPVIIKPSVKEPFYSRTKKKAIRVDNAKKLKEEFMKVSSIVSGSELMIQEFIPGGTGCLFSVGSIFKDGEFLGKVMARRTRQHPMDFGHATTYAETVDIPELEKSAKIVLTAMNYYGLSEVEFMLDQRDGKYKLIEINARPWGWHTLAIGAGVDLPYLLYLDMHGEKVGVDGLYREAKWIRLVTDIPTAIHEILKGRMKFTTYLRSLKGIKQFAVLSRTDPMPFFIELLMLPYLWKKRGF